MRATGPRQNAFYLQGGRGGLPSPISGILGSHICVLTSLDRKCTFLHARLRCETLDVPTWINPLSSLDNVTLISCRLSSQA